MSTKINNKTRVNITIDQSLRDALDERDIIKDKKLSGIINQLLTDYIKYGSINSMRESEQNFVKKEIKQSIAPIAKKIDSLEEKVVTLTLINTLSSISTLSDDEIVKFIRELPIILSTYKFGSVEDVIKSLNDVKDEKDDDSEELEDKFILEHDNSNEEITEEYLIQEEGFSIYD